MLHASPLMGTYLMWIDFRKLGMDAGSLKKFLREKAFLFSDEGDMFGKAGEGFVRIKTVGALAFTDKKLFSFALNYRIYPDGTIKVEATLTKPRFALRPRELSRFGVCMHLDASLQNVTYYGAGPYENLPDCRQQSTVGIFESTVRDLCENYIKPQENGMHMDTRFVRLTDDNGCGVQVHCETTPLTFSARPYKNKTLQKAMHREDLRDDRLVCLNVDGFVRGTGSNSCGPDVLAKDNLLLKDSLRFEFSLRPLQPAKENA